MMERWRNRGGSWTSSLLCAHSALPEATTHPIPLLRCWPRQPLKCQWRAPRDGVGPTTCPAPGPLSPRMPGPAGRPGEPG